MSISDLATRMEGPMLYDAQKLRRREKMLMLLRFDYESMRTNFLLSKTIESELRVITKRLRTQLSVNDRTCTNVNNVWVR